MWNGPYDHLLLHHTIFVQYNTLHALNAIQITTLYSYAVLYKNLFQTLQNLATANVSSDW